MPTGTVEMYKKDQGYGFIKSGSDEIFAHQKDIIEISGKDASDVFRFLNVGEDVSFETVQGDKGLKAVNIKVLSDRKPYERNGSNRTSAPKHQTNDRSPINPEVIRRLIEVLSDDQAEGGALITRDEVDYVLSGRRQMART